MATPNWSAARAGLLGNAGTVNASNQVNQFLGAHGMTPVYQGKAILTPNGTGGPFSSLPLSGTDKDQPFTMSGTTIGRVAIPMMPFGNGADLIVSLCADSAGAPATIPIAQTRVPAGWLTATAKYTAIPGTSPVQLAATDSPLATPSNNAFTMGNVVNFEFTGGTPSGGFGTSTAAITNNTTDTIVLVGGTNAAGTAVTNVFTITYEGTNALQNMLPQPGLPIGLFVVSGICVTTDPSSGDQYVIVTGGQTGTSPSYTTIANVYASQLSGTNEQMSAWTTQTALPTALQRHMSAASGNNVYVTGGLNASNQVQNTTYWANVQNGQITAWNTGPTLPVGVYDHFTVALNGFLFVIGGYTVPGNSTPTTNVWYAPISPTDGSLGSWQTGPALPSANAGLNTFFTAGADGVLIRPGVTQGIWSLTVDLSGPQQVWQEEAFPGFDLGALMSNGPGQYYWFEGFASGGTSYNSAGFIVCPYISVPLPATGLTNGATYHIVLQQPPGAADLNNYLLNVVDFNVFPGNPVQQIRTRGTTTWVPQSSAIPLTVYDQTDAVPVRHVYADNGARMSTLIYNTTPDRALTGVLEATQQPAPPMNLNSTFTQGFLPWSGNNGTISQSNAFTHGNLPFSAKFIPNGVSSQTYIESELMAIELQQGYNATCWFYSPTGYTNCEIIINWYGAAGFSGGFISSATGPTTSVAANTWTQLTVSAGANYPPATAVFATLGVYERGTPPATAIFYVSAPNLFQAVGPQLVTAAAVDYAGTWPGQDLWPPLGVTQVI